MKNLFYIGLLSVLLFGCGVKKEVVVEKQEADTRSLERRIVAGEFAWMDTIQIETELTSKLAGTYSLAYQNDLYGKKIADQSVFADSLILSSNGFYRLWKNDSLIDYGKYNITPYQRAIKICMEQYKIDPQTMMYSDEIISYDGYWGVWGGSQIYFTFISYDTTKTTYLGLYDFSNNHRFKLHFDVKMGDCYHYQWSGSNQIEWKRTK